LPEQPEQNLIQDLYRSMLRIRRVEQKIIDVYWDDKVKSPVHLSIGQEAVASGVCETLEPKDVVFGTYRGHHVYLAKGGDMNAMVAELYGKVTGCARGKGGSMHLIDLEHGVSGTSAVVGTTIANALGAAFAAKLKKLGIVVVVFFGDGAIDEGVYHESLNFASIKQLPIVFICENNGFAVHSRTETRRNSDNICEHARVYGITADRIEGNDVLAIKKRVGEAVDAIRSGESGPQLLEIMTYRWMEHVGPGEDFNLGYRTPEEREPWVEDDQIAKLRAQITEEIVTGIDAEVETEVEAAFEFAENSPFPEPEELYQHVYG
jgi:TPP-dependent pyruvate/acetoin dehydrogenase alpha subunit